MSDDLATYVYCLLAADRPPPVASAPPGLEGARAPRPLDAGEGLFAVVCDAPLDRYSAGAIERGLSDVEWVARRALEHESVVEHFLDERALVPMKLFTLFSSDARVLEDLSVRRSDVEAAVRRVAGRQEWGVRARHDPERASRAVESEEPSAAAPSGTAFLLRKKEQRERGRVAAREAREKGEALFAALRAHADDARRRELPQGAGPLVLDASFLVPEPARDAFHAAVRERTESLEPEAIDVVLSGPWPPYHFVEAAR